MNVVREIERINKAELARGGSGSWHDQYKDSAYIFVGGLASELTEGDVITIFSQYGEPVDINLPRDKQTGKTRGFGFLMYEDQRSTVLAVDNLNGAKVLGRTLRVDHVSKYKQLEKGEDGKFKESESERMNARPELFMDQNANSDSEGSAGDDDDIYEGIDPDDPMAAYLIAERKEQRALAIENGTYGKKKKKKDSSKHKGETKEERRARKEEKRRKKELKASGSKRRERTRSISRSRSRSRSPDRDAKRSLQHDDINKKGAREGSTDRRRRDDSPRGSGARRSFSPDRRSRRDSRSPRRRPAYDDKVDYRDDGRRERLPYRPRTRSPYDARRSGRERSASPPRRDDRRRSPPSERPRRRSYSPDEDRRGSRR